MNPNQPIRVHYLERAPREGSVVWDQILRLADLGIATDVTALYERRAPELTAPFVSASYPFFPKWEQAKSWLFLRAARHAVQLRLRQTGTPQLFHSHFAYPDGWAAMHLAREYGCPYIITGRGDDIELYPQRSPFIRRAVTAAVSQCDAFIGVSQHICEIAIAMGQDPAKCRHIPNGIPEQLFCRERPTPPPHQPLVLFVGDLLPVKNVLAMLDAWLSVAEDLATVRFRILGSGPLELRLKETVKGSLHASRFEFVAHVTHAEVVAHMRAATVLCLPSLSEGWPNVVMEALACGRPVVAAERGGIPEQINRPAYGLLCNPSDPAHIAAQLCAALSRSWDTNNLAARGRQYTRELACAQIANVYHEVTQCAE
jgi:teichuronic acid biosynthesis glycosyltransferase TuaC